MRKYWLCLLFALGGWHALALAAYSDIGAMAQAFSGSSFNYGKLIIGLGYLSGVGFGIASIYKFKQYKDNPTQIPIGTPFALLLVSILMVTMPGLINVTTSSIFGSDNPNQGACEGLPGGRNC